MAESWQCITTDLKSGRILYSAYRDFIIIMIMESMSLTFLAKGNCTACCEQENNARFLSRDTYHYLRICSFEYSAAWEDNRFYASQKIPHILWNQKVQYCIHMCPSLALPWARAVQSMPPHPTSWRSTVILSSHLNPGLPSRLFPSGFPTKTLNQIQFTCSSFILILCCMLG